MMKAILAVHIAAGAAALVTMSVPLVSRKGGTAHRRAGWVFVGGMAVVSVTSLLLGAERFVSNPWPGARDSALFLSFLGILTGGLVSAGVRVFKYKDRSSPHHAAWDLMLAGGVAIGAVALGIYGLRIGQPLFVAFSLLGTFSGGSQLAYWLTTPAHPMHWWFAHLNLMLGAAVAATTAFVVNNVWRLGVSNDSVFVWVAPTLLGLPAGILWTRHYRRRFDAIAPASVHSRRIARAAPIFLLGAIVAGPGASQTLVDGAEGLRFDASSLTRSRDRPTTDSRLDPNDSTTAPPARRGRILRSAA